MRELVSQYGDRVCQRPPALIGHERPDNPIVGKLNFETRFAMLFQFDAHRIPLPATNARRGRWARGVFISCNTPVHDFPERGPCSMISASTALAFSIVFAC